MALRAASARALAARARGLHTTAVARHAAVADGHAVWTPDTRRTGVLAVKCGMTSVWDHWGERIPVTVLSLDSCHVVQVKRPDQHGFAAVQVGIGVPKPKRLNKAIVGHFQAHSAPPKRKLAEFRVSEDALLEPGMELTCRHFVPGQFVDIQGVTKGKGFQGPIKRWGFGRQPASHGTSKTERAHGSTGNSQDPGKVWPGKKMAGHMGARTRSALAVEVVKVDPARNLLFVRGAVTGNAGAYVRVQDTRVWAKRLGASPRAMDAVPPFPTHAGGDDGLVPATLVAGESSPFADEVGKA